MKPSVYKPMRRAALPIRSRPDYFKAGEVRELSAPLMIDKASECHVTPLAVAEDMALSLDFSATDSILEPSAGTGNLVKALLSNGATIEQITMVERSAKLWAELEKMGPTVNACFLDYAGETGARFDRVIMNPPFSGVRKHMKAALSLLKPGGRCVALVPVTYENERARTIQTLQSDTFSTARVNTKIIEIHA